MLEFPADLPPRTELPNRVIKQHVQQFVWKMIQFRLMRYESITNWQLADASVNWNIK